MITTCNQCGAPIENNEKFCNYCGAKLNGSETSKDKSNYKSEKQDTKKNTTNTTDSGNGFNTNIKANPNMYKDELTMRIVTGEVVPTKNRVLAIILAFIFGYMGIHRFYLGQFAAGVAYILGCISISILSNNDHQNIAMVILIILVIIMFRDIICYIAMNEVKWCSKYGYKNNSARRYL